MPKVVFLNEQCTVEAKPGQTLLQVAEENGINLFRGIWPGLHCGSVTGWCNRCKVWASGLAPGAINERTSKEKRRFRINGALPSYGTARLACQVVLQGDCEVRTRPGFPHPVQTLEWQSDPRSSKWRDRWEHRNDEPAEEEKPKAKAGAKAAAGGQEPTSA